MGISCSSLRRNKKDKSDKSRAPLGGQRRCSDKSVDSLPYGTKKESPEKHLLTPAPSQITNDLLAPSPSPLPSSSPSPLPSSPLTTPSKGSSSLNNYPKTISNLLIGINSTLEQPYTRQFSIYLITNNIGEYSTSCAKIVTDLNKIFLQRGYELNLCDFDITQLEKHTNENCFKEVCLENLEIAKKKSRLIPLVIIDNNICDKRLPTMISAGHMSIINDKVTESCKALFSKWYAKDESYYRLQLVSKIGMQIKDWNEESQFMINDIKEKFNHDENIMNLFSSLIDDQINLISDISKYAILVTGLSAVQAGSSSAIDKLYEMVPTSNKVSLSCVENALKKLIETCIDDELNYDEISPSAAIGARLLNELIQQDCYRWHLNRKFIGRESIINEIQESLAGYSRIVIQGSKGMGKSAVCARIASLVSSWYPCWCVYRVVGLTSESRSVDNLLTSIAEQCCHLCGTLVPDGYEALIKGDWLEIIKGVNDERQLVIILDGLDELEDFGIIEEWIKGLKEGVKVIVSHGNENGKLGGKIISLDAISANEMGKIYEQAKKLTVGDDVRNTSEEIMNKLRGKSPLYASLLGHMMLVGGVEADSVDSIMQELTKKWDIIKILNNVKYGLTENEIRQISGMSYSEMCWMRWVSYPALMWLNVDGWNLMSIRWTKSKGSLIKSLGKTDSSLSEIQSLQKLLSYFEISNEDMVSMNLLSNRRKAQEISYLKKINFFDFQWILCKIVNCDVFSFIEDVRYYENVKIYLISKSDHHSEIITEQSSSGREKNIENVTSDQNVSQEKIEFVILLNFLFSHLYALRIDGRQILSLLYDELPTLSSLHSYPNISSLYNQLNKFHIPTLRCKFISNKSCSLIVPLSEDHLLGLCSDNGQIFVTCLSGKISRSLINIESPRDVKVIDKYNVVILCNRELVIYDLNKGLTIRKLKGLMNQKMPYYGLVSKEYLVALSRNRMYVNMVSLESGDLVTSFKVGEDRFLNSLLVCKSGKVCVCGDETQKPSPLLVWDLSYRKLLWDLRIGGVEFLMGMGDISDDGHYVGVIAKEINSNSPNFVVVYDLTSGTLFKKWKSDCDTVSIGICSNGFVAHCTIVGLIHVHDLSTGAKKFVLSGHSGPVDKLLFNEKGDLLLSYDSTGKDRTLRLWNLDNGNCIYSYTFKSRITSVALTPSGKSFVIALQEGLYTLLHYANNEQDIQQLGDKIYGDEDKEGQVFDMKTR